MIRVVEFIILIFVFVVSAYIVAKAWTKDNNNPRSKK